MATTDPKLAATLLDALEATGIPYAVLHREAEISRGAVDSDVDVVVGVPPAEAALLVADLVRSAGIGLALVSPYDRGALGLFWLSKDCASGVQVDLLRDPEGRGRLGVRTDALLASTERGHRWNRLSEEAEWLYLVSKRWAKSESHLLRQLMAAPPTHTDTLAGKVLADRALRRLRMARVRKLPSWWTPGVTAWRSRFSMRALRRMRVPAGALVRISGPEAEAGRIALDLRERLAAVVVRCDLVEGNSIAKRVRRLMDLRRPVVLLTTGQVGRSPEIVAKATSGGHVDTVVQQVWYDLGNRCRRQLESMSRVATRP